VKRSGSRRGGVGCRYSARFDQTVRLNRAIPHGLIIRRGLTAQKALAAPQAAARQAAARQAATRPAAASQAAA
jgi:hypothetical protein